MMGICLLLGLLCPPRVPVELLDVIDGDTLSIFDQKVKRVRILYIDAVEKDQFASGVWIGKKSSDYLKSLLKKCELFLEYAKKDMYGRNLAKVYCGDEDIGKKLVRSGWALLWPGAKFQSYKDRYQYRWAQFYGRRSKSGLWRYDFLRPWTFRKRQKIRCAKYPLC